MILNVHTYSMAIKKSLASNALFRSASSILTFMLIVITCHTTQAQFNQGRILLGGNVNFFSMKDETVQTGLPNRSSNSTQFQLSPNVGYFIIDNLAVGADVALSTVSGGSSSTTLLAGPFVRYYIKGLFVEGEYNFGSGKNGDIKSSTNAWLGGIGYAAFMNDHIAIEPTVAYTSNSTHYTNPTHNATIAGFVVGVGLQIYLGKRN